MKLLKVEAGSEEWRQLRAGIPTASQAHRIVTPGKLEPSKSQDDYMHELIAERMLGYPLDNASSDFMERGTVLEPEAVKLYELITNADTSPGGFCVTDDGRFGCSPDRLVGYAGGLELKCPKPATHVGYLINAGHAAKYRMQVLASLYVTGFAWWDLMSYHPDMPPALLRIERDAKALAIIGARIKEFCDRLDEMEKVARSKGEP